MLTQRSSTDPIFYLHHANIDRLWWMWLQKRPARWKYGRKTRESEESASAQDLLHFLKLGGPLVVSEAMRIDTGPFCYDY